MCLSLIPSYWVDPTAAKIAGAKVAAVDPYAKAIEPPVADRGADQVQNPATEASVSPAAEHGADKAAASELLPRPVPFAIDPVDQVKATDPITGVDSFPAEKTESKKGKKAPAKGSPAQAPRRNPTIPDCWTHPNRRWRMSRFGPQKKHLQPPLGPRQ